MTGDNNYFTLPYYLRLLNNAPKIIRVGDYRKYEAGLILRHDVDFSLDLAYELAKIENALDIRSTYYILLASDIYNPFSSSSMRILSWMIDHGFEVGIHFNPAIYKPDSSVNKLVEFLMKEVATAEVFLGIKIQSYSLHNPGSYGRYIRTDTLIGAYDDEIFGDDRYLSDSNFFFGEKDPLEWVKKSKHRLIQYCAHPALYLKGESKSYEESIKYVMQSYYDKLDTYFFKNRLYRRQYQNYGDIKIEANKARE